VSRDCDRVWSLFHHLAAAAADAADDDDDDDDADERWLSC